MSKTDYSKPRHMWATTAIHKLGDISRPKGDLCVIHGEDGDDYVGNFVTGFGFVEVRFPKATTHELTEEQRKDWNGRVVGIPGSWSYEINLGPLPGPPADAPVVNIDEWTVLGLEARDDGGTMQLVGIVSSHPHIPDGEDVTTSRICGKRGEYVATRNTLYRLGCPSTHSSVSAADLLAHLQEV